MAASPRLTKRLSHLLFGTSPYNLWRCLRRYGGVGAAGLGRLVFIAIGMTAFWPFGVIEEIMIAGRRRRAAVPAPLFIIGHWRSGTTLLHNLLAHDPALAAPTLLQGCIPRNFLGKLGLLRWCMRRCLPPQRVVDRLALAAHSPVETGLPLANLSPFSFWHALYFPRGMDRVFREGVLLEGDQVKPEWRRRVRALVEKLCLAYPGRRLVLKDPAHTAQVEELLGLFPGAQFIFLQRNPYEVFASTRHLYQTLLPELSLQSLNGLNFEMPILDFYTRLLGSYLNCRKRLPPKSLIEVRYENLVENPMQQLSRIYAELGLPGWEKARLGFLGEIQAQANYCCNNFKSSAEDAAKVKACWQFALEQWPYPEPE